MKLLRAELRDLGGVVLVKVVGVRRRLKGQAAKAQRLVKAMGKRSVRAVDKRGGAQPDPMKTSLGYIGADSFSRQRQEANGRGRPGGGGGQRRNGGRSR